MCPRNCQQKDVTGSLRHGLSLAMKALDISQIWAAGAGKLKGHSLWLREKLFKQSAPGLVTLTEHTFFGGEVLNMNGSVTECVTL